MPTAPKTFRLHKPIPQDERQWESRRTAYRGWYQLPMWRELRRAVLQRDCMLCQECLRQGTYTVVAEETKRGDGLTQGHADHIVPHAGNWERFVDMGNIETLCATCHSRKTVAESRGWGVSRISEG